MSIYNAGTYGLDVAAGGSTTITSAMLSAATHATSNIPTASQYRYTVTRPPTSGTLTRAGVPATIWTQQDVNDGLIAYHHTGGPDETWDFILTATQPPYTPTFANNLVGLYWGSMLVGTTSPPFPPAHAFGSEYNCFALGNAASTSGAVSLVGGADKVVVVSVASTNTSALATPVSVTLAGVTLSAIGSQSTSYALPSSATMAMGQWIYWAPLPASVSGTLSATFSSSATFVAVSFSVYRGVATPASPWDGAPQTLTATTFPATMTLTPAHADQVLTPLVYELNFELSAGRSDAAPTGFDFWGLSGQGPYGPSELSNAIYNRDTYRGTFYVYVDGSPVEIISTLAMDDVVCTAEAGTLSENLISLRWSDDRGHSWSNPVTQPFGAAGEYDRSLQWNRLGYARDRAFSLEWSVPAPTALQGAWITAQPGDGKGS